MRVLIHVAASKIAPNKALQLKTAFEAEGNVVLCENAMEETKRIDFAV